MTKAGFEIGIKIDRLEGELKKAVGEFKKFNEDAIRAASGVRTLEDHSRKASDGIGLLDGTFKRLAASMSVANIASNAVFRGIAILQQGLKAIFVEPIRQAGNFETTLARISTVVKNDSAPAMRTLSQEVLNLTKSVPKTADELGAGLYQILQSGIQDAGDAMKVLEVSSKAAVGGVTEVSTAAEVLTQIINAYGLSANEASSLADVMFVGAREGTAEFADLATSMGGVLSTASLLGISINEVVASIEAMSLAGINSDEGVTALNRLLLSVVNPSEEVRNQIASLKKEFKDFDFSAEGLKKAGLQEFMRQLSEVVGDNQELMVSLTGDVRAFKAASVIAGTGAENFNRILAATNNSAGALDEAFAKNANTIQNFWQLAVNELNTAVIETGQELLPDLKDALQDVQQAFADNHDNIIEAGKALGESLVGAIQAVVQNAPEIIDALTKIGWAAGKVAQAIGLVFSVAGEIKNITVGSGEMFGAWLGGVPFRPKPKTWTDEQAWSEESQDQQWTEEQLWSDAMPTGKTPKNTKGETATPSKPSKGGENKRKKELVDIEKELLKTYGEQAKANLTKWEIEKAELETRQALGIITEEETQRLEKINRIIGRNPGGAGDLLGKITGQLKGHDDKIKDATKSWEDQVGALKKVQDEIKDIQKRIGDIGAELKETLASIDKDFNKSAASTAVSKIDQIRNLIDTQKQQATQEGALTTDQLVNILGNRKDKTNTLSFDDIQRFSLDSSQVEQFNTLLDLQRQQADLSEFLKQNLQLSEDLKSNLSVGNQNFLSTAQGVINTDPFFKDANAQNKAGDLGKLTLDRDSQKREASDDANKRTESLMTEFNQARINEAEIKRLEQEKKAEVVKALNEREKFTVESFDRLDEATRKHVDYQLAEFARLSAGIANGAQVGPSLPGFSEGGYTGSVPANEVAGVVHGGEYVFDAEATKNLGVANLRALQSAAQTIRVQPITQQPKIVTVEKDLQQNITFPMQSTGDPYRDMKRAEFLALSLPPPRYR